MALPVLLAFSFSIGGSALAHHRPWHFGGPNPSVSPSPSVSVSPSPSTSPVASVSPSPTASASVSPSPSSAPSAKEICMQNAVKEKNDELKAIKDKRAQAMEAARQAKRNALEAAKALTDKDARKAAVKAATKQFRDSSKTINRTAKSEKKATMQDFKNDLRTCRN